MLANGHGIKTSTAFDQQRADADCCCLGARSVAGPLALENVRGLLSRLPQPECINHRKLTPSLGREYKKGGLPRTRQGQDDGGEQQ